MTYRQRPVIFGCAGPSLSETEKKFFAEVNPVGLILFERNIKDKAQVLSLTRSFRECVGRLDAPVLIDQEGGRVQRLCAPIWTNLPPAETYGLRYKKDAEAARQEVQAHAEILARELSEAGVSHDCWPCLDLAHASTHPIMKNRCFSENPECVTDLGAQALQVLLKRKIMPVVKHIPGYGRITTDPHRALPIIQEPLEQLLKTDFAPFYHIQAPVWGMTAHVIYSGLDPERPITLSERGIAYIRKVLKFNGFLICDDIQMKALAPFGSPVSLAQMVLASGCDALLHCSGILEEMEEIADVLPALTPLAEKRLKQSEAFIWK